MEAKRELWHSEIVSFPPPFQISEIWWNNSNENVNRRMLSFHIWTTAFKGGKNFFGDEFLKLCACMEWAADDTFLKHHVVASNISIFLFQQHKMTILSQ